MTHFLQPTAYHRVGVLQKAKGTQGAMLLWLDDPEVVFAPDCIFIYQHNTYVPYQVKSWEQLEKGHALFSVTTITDRTAAFALCNHTVFMDAQEVDLALENTAFLFKGFQVMDSDGKFIGVIVGLLENKKNPLLQVDFQGQELLIPFNEAFIQRIEKAKKTIIVLFPLGYLAAFTLPHGQ